MRPASPCRCAFAEPIGSQPFLQLDHYQPSYSYFFNRLGPRLLIALSLRCTRHASASTFPWHPIGEGGVSILARHIDNIAV